MRKRFSVIAALVLACALMFAGPATAAPSTGSAIPAGAADDFSELDRMIMESWLAQKLGQGFQRFLNGDGGGQGSDVAGPPPCPYCGATFPDTDQGWTDRAKHMLSVEWWKIVDDVQKSTAGTGSAG